MIDRVISFLNHIQAWCFVAFVLVGSALLVASVVVSLLHLRCPRLYGPFREFVFEPGDWWRRARTGSALTPERQQEIKDYVRRAREHGHDPEVQRAMETKWTVRRGFASTDEETRS